MRRRLTIALVGVWCMAAVALVFAATYTEDFAGAAADLTTPWVQWRTTPGTPAMRRNGSGAAQPTNNNEDEGAFYNNTVGNDQYSQFQPLFAGPGNATKYIYLFVRGPNTANSYNSGTGSWYWFWSDGGSDTQLLYTTTGAGTPTTLDTANSFTYASGDTIKLEVVGTTLKVYKNGTPITWTTSGTTSVTDSHIASGFPGFGLWGASPTADNWQGGDVTAPTTGPKRLLLLGVGGA